MYIFEKKKTNSKYLYMQEEKNMCRESNRCALKKAKGNLEK